jgi:hypothetical protein
MVRRPKLFYRLGNDSYEVPLIEWTAAMASYFLWVVGNVEIFFTLTPGIDPDKTYFPNSSNTFSNCEVSTVLLI